MRAVQIVRFGGPEVGDIVDVPQPKAGDGQELYDVSTAGINYADTHQLQPHGLRSRSRHDGGRRPPGSSTGMQEVREERLDPVSVPSAGLLHLGVAWSTGWHEWLY